MKIKLPVEPIKRRDPELLSLEVGAPIFPKSCVEYPLLFGVKGTTIASYALNIFKSYYWA